MNVAILGPQGAGKGTQAELIRQALGFYYLESGRVFRNIANTNPEIDEMINQKGELLSDEMSSEVIIELLEKEVPEADNILFDGFPRSLKQYEKLKKWLGEKGKRIDKAVLIEISEKESIRRLSSRRVCEACGRNYNLITNPPQKGVCECGGKLIQRKDDKPKAIRERLREYKKTTLPLIEVYKKEGILIEVDGERLINDIFEDIMTKIK